MIEVYILDMPSKIKSLVTKDEDGDFFIIINAKLNNEQQKEGYAHELLHIVRDDLCNLESSINEIESIVHGKEVRYGKG